MSDKNVKLPIIVGPTAVGKTSLSIRLAKEFGAEIISADSMQVYRGMDIGTAKTTTEEMDGVAHHLLDVADPREDFSVGEYLRLAENAIEDITGRGNIPLVVGGTGLYVKALLDGLFEGPAADMELREGLLSKEIDEPGSLHAELLRVDPASADKIHPSDVRRTVRALEVYMKGGLPISRMHKVHRETSGSRDARIVGLSMPRPELYARIERRVDAMMAAGFLEEVERLREIGCRRDGVAMQAIGYKQIYSYIEGEISLDEAVLLVKRDTKRFAKRQYTWFNADKRVIWVDNTGDEPEDAYILVKKALELLHEMR